MGHSGAKACQPRELHCKFNIKSLLCLLGLGWVLYSSKQWGLTSKSHYA
jgi:hypothetical protein